MEDGWVRTGAQGTNAMTLLWPLRLLQGTVFVSDSGTFYLLPVSMKM